MNRIIHLFKVEKCWMRSLLLLFLLAISTHASARLNWEDANRYFQAWFDNDKGCVVIAFRQGDDEFGPANENGYIESAEVKFNGSSIFKLSATDVNTDYNLSTQTGKVEQIYDDWGAPGWGEGVTGGRECYYKVVEWYSNTALSPGDAKVTISGTWDINGAYTTDPMSASRSVTVPKLNEINIGNITLDYNNVKTKIAFSKAESNGMDRNGSYTLYEKEGSVEKAVEGAVINGKTITIPRIEEKAKTYILRYIFTTHGATYGTERSFTIKGFSRPDQFEVKYNGNDRTVDLTWNAYIDQITGSYEDAGFVIYRRLKADTEDKATRLTSVAYSRSGSYSYSDKSFVDKENVNESYVYYVRRDAENTWIKDLYKTYEIQISTIHKAVGGVDGSGKASILYDSKNNRATVAWKIVQKDGLWTNGSKFVISRINRTANSREDIILGEKELKVESYVDEMINMCNKYYYSLQVIPGGNAYSPASPITTNEILPQEIGTINELSVSKGYFSDRVELRWNAEGGFERFIIQRRKHNEGDYVQISNTEASPSVKQYNIEDKNCIPGTLYDYRVFGVVQCADTPLSSNILDDVGFRTPTGDLYGAVTYKDGGQAVNEVEVRLESENGSIPGKSYSFAGSGKLAITNKLLMSNCTDSITLQAWIKPSNFTDDQSIIKKEGMYELYIQSDQLKFKVAGSSQTHPATIKLSGSNPSSHYVQVTATYKKIAGSQYLVNLYIDGAKVFSETINKVVTGNENQVIIGNGFKGNIDEVRIWGKALSDKEVKSNYNRYLVGNESGLLAYYTFNYSIDTDFYDTSYDTAGYHENHGMVTSASLSSEIPTNEQLGYKAITNVDGTYSIRAIPYTGSGSSYYIIPRLGIHQFSPQQEIRLFNAEAQNYTVNFTDNSSFKVSGFITYNNSTIPVEGAMFTVDGVTCIKSNGTIIQSGADGAFEISVPVGTHEVKAVMTNHKFANDGKITNSDGTDRNYQDALNNIQLKDLTTIRYIGRVAGGTIQEAYPIGHSLSTNNLADGITVTLAYQDERYDVYRGTETDSTLIINHFKPSNTTEVQSNKVTFGKQNIIIYPNPETGEFVADVFPIKFKAQVSIPGHESITLSGDGQEVDFSQSFIKETSIREYTDSVQISKDKWEYTNYSDTVRYNKSQLFIGRYTPELEIVQLSSSGKDQVFYGDEKASFSVLDGTSREFTLYDSESGKYLIGKPVFQQGVNYRFKARIFEKFVYTGGDKNGKVDKVPTQDAKFTITNTLATQTTDVVEADEKGECIYGFQVGEPELTSASGKMTAQASYGDNGSNSIEWKNPLEAIVTGSHQTGTNFVTGGPNKLLTVLRDPPGSKSYAYLEKGTAFTESSTIKTGVKNEGDDTAVNKLGWTITTFTGIGAGVISSVETDNSMTVGVHHEENLTGTSSRESTTTTTTRFQTSDDPLYVGANGDVFVGYSTNISYGMAQAVAIISKKDYEAAGSEDSGYEIYEDVTSVDSDYLLIKQNALGAGMTFGTLFAYTQVYIENTLIPNLESMRNSFLQPNTRTEAEYQAEADRKHEAVYVSYLSKDDYNFGKSNNDKVFTYEPERENLYDGKSYKIYFPVDAKAKNDTILYLNQSVDNWYKQLAANEKAKVKAELLQNYSFQAGASIEYSEGYTGTQTDDIEFSMILGMTLENSFGTDAMGLGVEFTINESLTTEVTTSSSSSEEQSHTKGFVLAEDGDDDYISVDVCREPTLKSSDPSEPPTPSYSSFIFKTKAGATSCPYEGNYIAKYYEPEQNHVIDQATIQIEVPEISVEKDFIENVPSGKSAYFTLYLRNNSEMQEDGWYNLKIVDSSNPDGAQLSMDGAAIGNGRAILVLAGETLVKTLEVKKGSVMNYNLLQLTLQSQCQCDPTDFLDNIADTVSFSVHFTPSCTDVNIKKPSNNWTYNTKLKTELVNGVDKHYMDVVLDGFDVNYDNFNSIRLQYKSASGSDEDWTTLITYFNDSQLYDEAITKGINAKMILAEDAGSIKYKWFLDDMPDQRYDLRAVSICIINNTEVENISETRSGIKDMYCPRLFGSAQPANGILTINDEVRLNFNETISDGLLTVNNFQVKGVRNGTKTDHSTSVRLDGTNDYFESQFNRNWNGKDLTIEMWVLEDQPQDATFFSQGNQNESLEFGITADNKLKIKVGSTEVISQNAVSYDQGTWAHVAMTIDKGGNVSAYYNYVEVISNVQAEAYTGEGNFVFGRSIATEGNYLAGKIHNARVWDKVLTSGRLQTNSLNLLSGTDNNLLAYYPMNEAKGNVLEDKARGANLEMKGGEWVLPEGRAANFNGSQYLAITTGSAVITNTMDYTLEFWFKAEPGQTDATLVANGRGDGLDMGGSANMFFIGFEDGALTFHNNEVKATAQGDYLDNNWHHFALAVNRTTGRAQMIIDGNLNTYFDAQDLGGISAAKTYLGARVWTEEEDITMTKKDNFFRGSIDDFRFWNLYKSESIVSENNNERLDGKEKGLLAYYPFEHYIDWQGTKELQFTLADQKVQSDPTQKIPDGVVNEGVLETSDIAPVKDKGPVSDLLYDFVVNDDALIINLNEPWEKVEKTIVTFTVDGVRDVNGNEIVSPITWSAYIDRNQLKWSESEVTIEKKENEPLTFKLQAQNLGGSVQHFTIENMPSWMDVTPSEGTVNPKSNLDITFTIDEGLNIGSYDEVVYMRNDNNVSEALPVNIKVNGEKPDWSVNPKNFKYSMNVYGKLRINNIFSIDKEDMLAAFSNGQCVGVVNNQYLKVNDMWYAFLTVYNNNSKTDDLEFRIWDASTGKIYMATTTETVTFLSDKVWGSAVNPLIFDAKEMTVQNVAVDEGWNWVSFNVETEMLKNVQATLKNNQWTSGDFIKDETNSKFVSYLPKTSKWIGTMTASGFDNKHMYLIKSSQVQTISVTGTPIKSKEDLTLEVKQGWNYISYLPNVNLTLKEALAGYNAQEGDIIKGQNEFSMFGNNNLGWLGNLTYMKSGQGYMLYRGGEATNLVYPSISGTTASKAETRAMVNAPAYENKQYAQNMSVVATINGTSEAGDRILAYAGNELRGVGEAISNPVNDSILYFISINGENQESMSFVLEHKGEVIAQTNAEFDYSSNTVKGSIQRPYVLNFMTESSNNVYPNPFNRELNIVMSVEPKASVEICINDISGRLVRHYDAREATNGYIHITLNDLEGFAAGIYMVNVKVDGENNIYKVEKK